MERVEVGVLHGVVNKAGVLGTCFCGGRTGRTTENGAEGVSHLQRTAGRSAEGGQGLELEVGHSSCRNQKQQITRMATLMT